MRKKKETQNINEKAIIGLFMHKEYVDNTSLDKLPRLPLKGSIDLTYRCNNNCRHCWLKSGDGTGELTTGEIKRLVDDTRAFGVQGMGNIRWRTDASS